MSETSKMLVPLHDVKQADYAFSGDSDSFAYHNSLLTPEHAELIARHISLKLYFGAHGTDPDNYLAAERAFDDFDPTTTTLCFENVGFSLIDEQQLRNNAKNMPVSHKMRMQREAVLASRNSVGGNYLVSTNAFVYAQNFCVANGYDVRMVDRDGWETGHWTNTIREQGKADDEPLLDELTDAFWQKDWLDFDFTDALQHYSRLGDQATVLIQTDNEPFVVYRWREQHRLREESVARRLKDLALEKALEIDGDKTNPEGTTKHTIALFFGAAHSRGIQMRLNELSVPFTTTMLTDEKLADSAADLPIDGGNAYAMMHSLLGSELWRVYGDVYNVADPASPLHPKKLQNIQRAVSQTFNKLPHGALAEFYEAYRNYRRWHEADTTEAAGAIAVSNLARRLAQERRRREDPKVVLEKLIGNTFEKYGFTLGQAIAELEFASQESTRKLFGQIQ